MPFRYGQDGMSCEQVSLAAIAAEVGTPCYIYSASTILDRFRSYDAALAGVPHQICYAVKANSNVSILRLLQQEGAGFDIVSGGELFRVLQAGGDPRKIVFSGVGKTEGEIEYALRQPIGMFNCESEPELALLNNVARRLGVHAPVALRVNPDVDAATHPYISTGLSEHKFGIDIGDAERIYAHARTFPNLDVHGVSCHIGSQMLDPGPMMEAVDRMLSLVERLRASGTAIRHVDLGGGLGVPYRPTDDATPIEPVMSRISDRLKGTDFTVSVEPGRSIVAEAGILLTKVLYRKRSALKQFLIVDAAMNDLIRPALYKSYHEIQPVTPRAGRPLTTVDVVGPVCESGDFLAHGRDIEAVEEGELLAVRTAGAYGFTQASNYNSRTRPAEVLVQGDQWRIIRTRETYEDLIRGE